MIGTVDLVNRVPEELEEVSQQIDSSYVRSVVGAELPGAARKRSGASFHSLA